MVVEPFVGAPPLPPTTSPSSVDLRTEGGHSIRKGDIANWSGQGMGSRASDIGSRSQVGLDSQGASPAYRSAVISWLLTDGPYTDFSPYIELMR